MESSTLMDIMHMRAVLAAFVYNRRVNIKSKFLYFVIIIKLRSRALIPIIQADAIKRNYPAGRNKKRKERTGRFSYSKSFLSLSPRTRARERRMQTLITCNSRGSDSLYILTAFAPSAPARKPSSLFSFAHAP